jgi:hypothetical protein
LNLACGTDASENPQGIGGRWMIARSQPFNLALIYQNSPEGKAEPDNLLAGADRREMHELRDLAHPAVDLRLRR